MSTTYPLATLAPVISLTGISAPTYADILESLKESFKLIYGNDAYLEPDSQDGQLLAVFAQALHDANQAAIMVYNSFSPHTAVGVGLSNVVKINHMQRAVATKSQVNVTLSGTAGTVITDGVVGDGTNRWNLPATVTISVSGDVTVTATAEVAGAIAAPAHTVIYILTPVAGWMSVDNANEATSGNPVESDAELRSRQAVTPAVLSQSTEAGLLASLRLLTGVVYVKLYENDTNSTDGNGVPAHSIAIVIDGGDATEIAETIFNKKGQGCGTHGTTTINVLDASGLVRPIKFTTPTSVPLKVTVALTAHEGYTSLIGDDIRQAIADFITAMDVGEDLVVNRLFLPALLGGPPVALTYTITSLQAGLLSGAVGTSDIVIGYTSRATCLAANVTLTVS